MATTLNTPSVHNPLHARGRQHSLSDSPTPRTVHGDLDEDHDPFYQGGGTHWAASSALAPISFGENSLLEEIEKRESEEESATAIQSRARAGTRLRSGTVANELQVRTQGGRRGTIVDGIGERPMLFTDRATKFRQLFNFMESLVPRLQQRLNLYTSVFFFITILSLANYYDDPKSWYGLYFALVAIDLATAIIDQMIFVYFIDKVFIHHFDIAYLLHGFNGPLGMLISIFIIGAAFKNFTATTAVPNWDNLISALTIILLCICVKNWYSRKHYIRVLERRFSDKLFKLQSWTSLLSELATYRSKHGDGYARSHGSQPNRPAAKAESAFIPGLEAFQRTFIDVFADLVEATSKYSDEFEDDVDVARKRSGSVASTTSRSNAAATATTGQQVPASVSKKINAMWRGEIRKKRTFWELAARMSMNMGALMIYTYNGRVIIRRKFQAKSFGKSLFLHLSHGGKELVTHETLRKIFEAQMKTAQNKREGVDGFDDDDDDEDFGRRRDREYHAISMINKTADKDNTTLLFETAVELFDPFRLGYITEEQCMAALCLVYKEQRFAATSLNDYGELHHSLRTVVDSFFWIAMVIFLQSFMEWNIQQYYVPFLTMILSVSFALSSSLGNMFLCMVFVFFMSPFEIGNKIYIGSDPNTRITGFVKSVSLFYTVINTSFNETMKIPNHTLFNEKISNLAESGGCVYALDIHFPLSPDYVCSQAKLDEFCDRLKAWVLVENKLDWQACMVNMTGINVKENVMNVQVWATHRDTWQDVSKASLARNNLVRYMKWLQNDVGLTMVRLAENVRLVPQAEEFMQPPPGAGAATAAAGGSTAGGGGGGGGSVASTPSTRPPLVPTSSLSSSRPLSLSMPKASPGRPTASTSSSMTTPQTSPMKPSTTQIPFVGQAVPRARSTSNASNASTASASAAAQPPTVPTPASPPSLMVPGSSMPLIDTSDPVAAPVVSLPPVPPVPSTTATQSAPLVDVSDVNDEDDDRDNDRDGDHHERVPLRREASQEK